MDINENGKDDVQEIKDGFSKLFADAKALDVPALVQDLKNGAAWVIDEIDHLTDEAKAFFSAVVAKVQAESKTLGEAVANALTVIYNDSYHTAVGLTDEAAGQLKALSSSAVQKALSLLTTLPIGGAATA